MPDAPSIAYVPATAELAARLKTRSGTNAADFVRVDDDHCSLIALAEGEPVALIVAVARPLSAPLQAREEAFILIVEVLEPWRRRGIGSALVRRVETWARERQAFQVRAWSEEIRQEALALWDRLGYAFSEVGFRRGDEKCYGFYVAKRV